ncbi:MULTISPECIES: SusD/RagB family nutrient-binding outer membrane lipoprotein [Chitinophaga]|uniref:SusD/RagB family nutrient-binding outer membrane lipoprotein n=1 Tax=Chitinophaga TaxID=79328 RepID=UPI000BAF9C9B|nr:MULTISPECIES: SusD/RagB family nutrient-binding outer membrane lipoprotein [Chitinophaga]ASZ14746.1 SusD/RagB family nutrient-binding outer membrane lipoprotein [Chitinophaga sp. MD30]
MRKILWAMSPLLISSMISCKKFEDFQQDPNKPTVASPELVLTAIETRAFSEISLSAPLSTRQLAYTDGVDDNQYYGWQRSGFGDYGNLRQVVKMEQEAQRIGKPVYLAVAKFFRAWYFMRMTLTFGDIPYKTALQGAEGELSPVYDSQESIFTAILDDLKAANAALDPAGADIQGDVVYSGKIQRWKQLINSFSLRILMSLSMKENNSKLNIRQRFREIVEDPAKYPLFTGLSDQAQLTFYDLKDNRYPYFNNNNLQTAYYLEETFVQRLQTLKDPRLFRFADKANKYASLPATDFNAYGGVRGSATISENSIKVSSGEASKIAKRYYNDPVNEPGIAFGYPELQFILAEAVVRGWISGDAAAYYKKGIQSSMEFFKVPAADITAYLAQPAIQLVAGKELEMILTQKHISFFMNSGWQSFYEQRRTGLPELDVSGGGVLNNKRIPKRWMYPESEFDRNRNNVQDAINRQYPEGDNINGTMWLLKKD